MTTHPQAIVVIGVAGSGKSTVARALARRLDFVFLDADDFHSAEFKAAMASGAPPPHRQQRDPWVGALVRESRALAARGRS